MLEFSASEARLIALNAQGFGSPRPKRADRDGLRRVVDQTRLVQIDSVNVLARAHYLPFFSRLGPYKQSWLDDLAYQERALFEQWGHAASFIPAEHYPLFRHRMERGNRWWRAMSPERQAQFEQVVDEVRERGPVTVSDLETEGRRQGWWQWSDAKVALEWNFAHGRLAVRERRNFARVYDLPERVFDPAVLARPGLAEVDAHREMVRLAAGAMGIATASDLADYYRIPVAAARQRARELVAEGTLEEAKVEGWRDTSYLARGAAAPPEDANRTAALLSPFDSLLWNRDRTERLFGFYYRIEIYVPAAQRVHGYYVLPFLMDGDLAARVDLKADRKAKTLIVQGAFAEPGRNRQRVAAALKRELKLVARWLELERIEVVPNGDVAVKLSSGPV